MKDKCPSAKQYWASQVVVFFFVMGIGSLSAQVTLDGSLGPSGSVTGPNFDITADLGLTRGNNLFHSFSQFDLVDGDTAAFSGPGNIQNILGRVTGGDVSSIDGAIRSDIAGANLFLVNPNGIVFGPNASVNVNGAFAASSADYLKLADGAHFEASLSGDDSTLSTAPVTAFGFLDGPFGEVNVKGTMEVAPTSTLSLVGGDVEVQEGSYLEALQGSVHLTGVSEVGEIDFSATSDATTAGSVESAAQSGNNIVIRGGRLVVDDAQVSALANGGEIDIAVSDSLSVVNGGGITTGSFGSTPGGDIQITTPTLELDGRNGMTRTAIAAETSGKDIDATGGNIQIQADEVVVKSGAEISVSTSGAANAGQLSIDASSLLLEATGLSRHPTRITADAAPTIGAANAGRGGEIIVGAEIVEIKNGAGILATSRGDADAGSVNLTTRSLTLANGGIATSTFGAGSGGRIEIISETVTLDGPASSITAFTAGRDLQSPAGNGGVIEIETGTLNVLDDAVISANTLGDGDGGNISINASEILLDAPSDTGSLRGISAASRPLRGDAGQPGGQGGNISIATDSLTIRNGMVISTATKTTGDGGSINIHAANVNLEDGGSIQSASETGAEAGTITLEVGQDVLLSGASTISTSAPESSGGNIVVSAGDEVQLFGGSKFTAQAGPGGGGSITVNAPNLIYLLDSSFDAQAEGDGGNLTIDPIFFILNRSALISKSSTANGGNITIQSDYFFQSESTIDASAPFGLPGEVKVTAPEVNLSGVLVGLSGNLLDVDTLLQPDCAVRLIGDVSSFVIMGRGGLPLTPGGFVPSGMILLPNKERE